MNQTIDPLFLCENQNSAEKLPSVSDRRCGTEKKEGTARHVYGNLSVREMLLLEDPSPHLGINLDHPIERFSNHRNVREPQHHLGNPVSPDHPTLSVNRNDPL